MRTKYTASSIQETAADVREAVAPAAGQAKDTLTSVAEQARAVVAETVVPALSEAAEKLAPLVEEAKDAVVPVATAAIATTKDKSRKAAEHVGVVDQPKKKHRVRKLLIVLGIAAAATFVYKKLSGGKEPTWTTTTDATPAADAAPTAPLASEETVAVRACRRRRTSRSSRPTSDPGRASAGGCELGGVGLTYPTGRHPLRPEAEDRHGPEDEDHHGEREREPGLRGQHRRRQQEHHVQEAVRDSEDHGDPFTDLLWRRADGCPVLQRDADQHQDDQQRADDVGHHPVSEQVSTHAPRTLSHRPESTSAGAALLSVCVGRRSATT